MANLPKEIKEFAAKEKLEIVLSAPVPAFTQEFRSGRQGSAGGRGVWGEFRPPSLASSFRIFSNRHRQVSFLDEINESLILINNYFFRFFFLNKTIKRK